MPVITERRRAELLERFGGKQQESEMGTERRGFASMTRERQREIASKGGKAAHEKGTAHQWTAEEAREAGRKGGMASRGGRGRLIETTTDEAATV